MRHGPKRLALGGMGRHETRDRLTAVGNRDFVPVTHLVNERGKSLSGLAYSSFLNGPIVRHAAQHRRHRQRAKSGVSGHFGPADASHTLGIDVPAVPAACKYRSVSPREPRSARHEQFGAVPRSSRRHRQSPVPVSATVNGPFGLNSLMVRVPVCAPDALGLKAIASVHLPPAATEDPQAALLVMR
jgi:hypothetical protein